MTPPVLWSPSDDARSTTNLGRLNHANSASSNNSASATYDGLNMTPAPVRFLTGTVEQAGQRLLPLGLWTNS